MPAPPARVRQALVPASLLTSVLDGGVLHGSDVTPLLVHVLRGLQAAGVSRAVVVLGVGAEQLVETVKQEHFRTLVVEFLWGVQVNWGSSLANNIMAARSAFVANDEPLLIVRSDYLFDWRLLDRMVGTADYFAQGGVDACALVDAAPETLEWVSGAHCKAYCRDGHCHALVKVLRGHGDRIARIGHRLNAYDALSAGIYVVRPGAFFSEMARLLSSARFITVAEAMQSFAECGRLRFLETADERCNQHWFGHEVTRA